MTNSNLVGSIISIHGTGVAKVRKVDGNKIHILNLDGECKECYYNDIEYVWRP